jgi:hypothetical protein
MLQRGASGHSPTTDEIEAAESAPGVTDPAIATALVPLLTRALADPDAAMRQYALAMLVGMQTLPDPPAAPAASASTTSAPASQDAPAQPGTSSARSAAAIPPASGPAVYQSEVAKALAPAIPAITSHLIDEDLQNRLLTTNVLCGFSPNAPAAVLGPLLAFLKRDDAVGAVGLSVVSDLLQIGPVGNETAGAIAVFLRRPDQTAETRANLVEAIASKPNQSQTVNHALLSYLDSDDAALRARLILSLPLLDLAPQVYADTKTRIADLASGGQDSLQVVNAAKAVAGCWTSVKMTAGCPVYDRP